MGSVKQVGHVSQQYISSPQQSVFMQYAPLVQVLPLNSLKLQQPSCVGVRLLEFGIWLMPVSLA